jgi:hypothetical protein
LRPPVLAVAALGGRPLALLGGDDSTVGVARLCIGVARWQILGVLGVVLGGGSQRIKK